MPDKTRNEQNAADGQPLMPDVFDFTALSTFNSCKYKYFLRHVLGIVGKQPPIAAEFGRVMHLCLDEMYKSWDLDKCTAVLKANWKDSPEDEKRTIAVGEKILKLYHEKYKDPPFKVLASEIEFTVAIPETPYKLIGRIDKIIDWHGTIEVMDHKTTSSLGATYFYKIKPNAQFTGYVWAARSLGYPASGILLDAVLVAKGLLVPAQLARLTPLGRDEALVTQDDIEDWRVGLLDTIASIYECYKKGTWPKTGMFCDSCCDFVECPYRKICKEDANIREAIIISDYKVEPWDPRKEVTNA